MRLSVMERVLLGSMMASYQGSFVNLKLIREGREALSFDEEETKKLKFVPAEGNITWDPTASLEFQDVEVNLGEKVTSIIKSMLTKLNDEEKLTEQHFSLYEKFMT